ncbi:MAG: hypothetical protein ACRD5Z_05535, partial [Bryobacteraceae bacterium]
MILLLVVVIVIVFGAYSASAIEGLGSVFDGIGRALEDIRDRARNLAASACNCLRQPDGPRPLQMMLGFFVLAGEIPILVADYKVLGTSLSLVWPTETPPLWLPLAVVIATALAGLLLHSIRSKSGKLVMLLIVLL